MAKHVDTDGFPAESAENVFDAGAPRFHDEGEYDAGGKIAEDEVEKAGGEIELVSRKSEECAGGVP